jgi:hypothetical protein
MDQFFCLEQTFFVFVFGIGANSDGAAYGTR